MFAVVSVSVAIATTPQPLVVIDPGHGGEHLGAPGACGVPEKDIVLPVALELTKLLNASRRVGAMLTRSNDQTVGLDERYQMANAAHASLFVSVHANASPNPAFTGVETFFLSLRATNRRLQQLADRENEGQSVDAHRAAPPVASILDSLLLNDAHQVSQRLAIRVQTSLEAITDTGGRGVLQAPFIVLLGAKMPAVLVEIGFVTNEAECEFLTTVEHQRKIARALAAAVLAHFPGESVASVRH